MIFANDRLVVEEIVEYLRSQYSYIKPVALTGKRGGKGKGADTLNVNDRAKVRRRVAHSQE